MAATDFCLRLIHSLKTPQLETVAVSELESYVPKDGVQQHRFIEYHTETFQAPPDIVLVGRTCERL